MSSTEGFAGTAPLIVFLFDFASLATLSGRLNRLFFLLACTARYWPSPAGREQELSRRISQGGERAKSGRESGGKGGELECQSVTALSYTRM